MTEQQKEIRFYRSTGKYGFLSNLFKANIKFMGEEFETSEAAYQFGKPKSEALAYWLVMCPYPDVIATTAHGLSVFRVRSDWAQTKVDRMRKVLHSKFIQHPELGEKLLATKEAVLIEESNTDAFWGIGKKGTGKNMLGILLMELRTELTSCSETVEEKKE
jgi:ribA/ribD-fused uncharacterized protein